jgi:hypothetical protein
MKLFLLFTLNVTGISQAIESIYEGQKLKQRKSTDSLEPFFYLTLMKKHGKKRFGLAANGAAVIKPFVLITSRIEVYVLPPVVFFLALTFCHHFRPKCPTWTLIKQTSAKKKKNEKKGYAFQAFDDTL